MKDSGIPWIGDMPSHWRMELIGSCIKEVNNPNTDNAEDNALQFKMGTIISKKGGDSKYNPETLEAYNKVQQGDIIINGLNLSFDFISQRVGLVKENGVITSTYLALRPLPLIDSRFLNYLFKGYDNCKALHSMGRGLRATLGYNEFRKYSVIFPSLHEQQSIADFLDKKCSEIDEMVSLQEKIAEELKAYKQSVITEAVCKGLNPNAPQKDSEIPWLGTIKADYSLSKLIYFLDLLTDGTHQTPTYIDSGYAFLSIKDMSSGRLDFSNVKYISEEEHLALSKHAPIEKGDILFSRIGTMGVFVKVDTDTPFDIFVSVGLMKVKKNAINTDYLVYYLSSSCVLNYINQVKAGGGTSAAKFNLGDVAKTMILVPDIEEQEAIVKYLDKKCGEVDTLISLKKSKIEALKEYKKSIIYEYITGKKEIPYGEQ